MKQYRIHDNFASLGYNLMCNIELTLRNLNIKGMTLGKEEEEWLISDIDKYIKKHGDDSDRYYVELTSDGTELFYDQYDKYINNKHMGGP